MTNRREFTAIAAVSAATLAFGSTAALTARSRVPSRAPVTNPDLAKFYERYIAALNARDLATVDGMVHEQVLRLGVPYPRSGVINSFKVITDAVPDYRWNIQDLLVEDDRIAVRLQNTGTPVKPFVGHAPTGRSLNFMEFASYKVRDGRFAEMWFLMDEASVARQLRGEG